MRYDMYCQYCEWLFDLLFKLEKEIDLKIHTGYQQRVMGYLAERLLDVWVLQNNIKYKDVNYVVLENVNWLKKIALFIKRKFIKDK